jgi:hypothetical protein
MADNIPVVHDGWTTPSIASAILVCMGYCGTNLYAAIKVTLLTGTVPFPTPIPIPPPSPVPSNFETQIQHVFPSSNPPSKPNFRTYKTKSPLSASPHKAGAVSIPALLSRLLCFFCLLSRCFLGIEQLRLRGMSLAKMIGGVILRRS